MAHNKAADSKREQFRQYLEKSGVLDMLTKVRRGGRQKNSPGKLGAAWPGNGARGARRGGARRERAAGRRSGAPGLRGAPAPRLTHRVGGSAGGACGTARRVPYPRRVWRRHLCFGQSAIFNACFWLVSLFSFNGCFS
ncbi:C-Myc-binding protein isoform X1 [Zonotrichia albicollis]|uniref:C-Myc-binding protein isoform X1 n=1 Tax=Zonotrichia albicollis TaxID=44394 RepID=UPI003D80DDCF